MPSCILNVVGRKNGRIPVRVNCQYIWQFLGSVQERLQFLAFRIFFSLKMGAQDLNFEAVEAFSRVDFLVSLLKVKKEKKNNCETCLGKIIERAVHEEKEKKPQQNWQKIVKHRALHLFHIEKKPRASPNSFIGKTFSVVKLYVGRLSQQREILVRRLVS